MLEEEKGICGLYLRVSTEDQVREGFSIPKQKERLEAFCKYNNFEIKEYYVDAGISAKAGNHRPEFERMIEDGKQSLKSTLEYFKEIIYRLVQFLMDKIFVKKDKRYEKFAKELYVHGALDKNNFEIITTPNKIMIQKIML